MLKECLWENFGKEQISFVFEGDDGITGAFEVTIRDANGKNAQLIHSKNGGQGKCETQEEMDVITDKISSFLQMIEANSMQETETETIAEADAEKKP